MFEDQDAVENQEKLLKIGIHQVEHGDLLFTARPDWFQTLCHFAGVAWRHIGLIQGSGTQARVLEVGSRRIQATPLDGYEERYERVGIARLGLDRECIDLAIQWADAAKSRDTIYAWDEVVLAGIISLTRRGVRTEHLQQVVRVVERAAQQAAAGPTSGAGHTCSSFIFQAFDEAGDDCRVEIDLSSRVPYPTRGHGNESVHLDELLALPHEECQEILNTYSLWDLFGSDIEDSRAILLPDDHMTADQFARSARMFMAGIAAATDGDTRAAAPLLDSDPAYRTLSRWTTPADFWQSPSVSERYRLK